MVLERRDGGLGLRKEKGVSGRIGVLSGGEEKLVTCSKCSVPVLSYRKMGSTEEL